jgi:hypothetical protein
MVSAGDILAEIIKGLLYMRSKWPVRRKAIAGCYKLIEASCCCPQLKHYSGLDITMPVTYQVKESYPGILVKAIEGGLIFQSES